MSSSVTTSARGTSALSPLLEALYAPVAEELAEAEEVFRREMRSDYPFVDELAQYGVMLGGKRLRPALLLLAGKAAGPLTGEHVVLAAVMEMIHTATLVHDDVLDEAALRRHIATVNSRWGSEASVLLGDYLFTHSFYLASTLGSTLACRWIGRATNVVCEGELRQVHHRGNFLLSEAEYLSIIEAKTAELCACCCRLGGHYALASEDVVERMDAFGRNLGIAFQIADDLLDLVGDPRSTGKSLGTDLAKQKVTLPLIRVIQVAPPAERDEVLALLNAGESECRSLLAPYLERFQACDYARQKAQHYAAAAREALEVLPASPSRDVLLQLAQFAVARPG